MRSIFLSFLLLLTTVVAQAQITAPAVEQKADNDAKYLAGAVIDDNGEAVLRRTISLTQSLSQSEVMNRMDAWLTRCMNDERIRHNVRLEQPADNVLQHHCTMELTFSLALLAHDFADFTFTLVLKAEGNQVTMEMRRMSYKYRATDKVQKFPAEEMISDKVALNKHQDKMVVGYKKFRVTTINLMDELQVSLEKDLNN